VRGGAEDGLKRAAIKKLFVWVQFTHGQNSL
jgi:hypothetical protein